MKKKKLEVLIKWCIWVATPLVVGALFYRFLRPRRTAIFGKGPNIDLPLPAHVGASLPSLLWSFALTAALLLIWKPKTMATAFTVAGFTALISVVFEGWQAAEFGRGTFDWNDCLFSVVGCLAAIFFLKNNI
ncbi:MAG: hypothetical protein GC192_00270 [Bacteroidetes bacterium]|nr:hypothetical protein [Bacteroidota bacterium]